MAVSLSRMGVQVALIEKSQFEANLKSTFDGRVSAIAAGSKTFLEHIGVWQQIQPHAQAISDIRVSDADAPVFLHYHYEEVADEPFGYIVENRHTRNALYNCIKASENITIYESASVEVLKNTASNVEVILSDDRIINAQLLLAADGKFSNIRERLQIQTRRSKYYQTAIVATIAHSMPHDGLAQERFLPAGPFAVLPMQNNCSSLVWVEPDDRVQLYMDLPDEEFIQEITERVGGYLGEISIKGPRFTYPLSLMHAEQYTAPRCALIGDAAHSIHPIAGQGVNLGFRDVAVMAELVREKKAQGLDIGAADLLEHYARWRRLDNVTMLAVTDGLNRLFSNDWLLTRCARGTGLNIVSKLPGVKKFFMRHAMGAVGDVPPLMRAKNEHV